MPKKIAGAEKDLLKAFELEQRRLGELLHDSVCQTLTGAALLLEKLLRDIRNGRPAAPQNLDRLRQILGVAIDQLRALSDYFNPATLKRSGLIMALEKLAAQTPRCDFICERPLLISDEVLLAAVYRVAQETLEAFSQHKSGRLLLKLQKKDKVLVLQVAGAKSLQKNSLHLARLRVRCLGGAFIRKSATKCSTVTWKFPLARRQVRAHSLPSIDL